MSERTVSWKYINDDVKWEYKVIEGGLYAIETLNAIGESGWELCAVASLGKRTPEDTNNFVYYFKRPRIRLKDKTANRKQKTNKRGS